MNIQLLDALFKRITDNNISVFLEYNGPRLNYQTVEEVSREWSDKDWSSPIDRDNAIQTNTVWKFYMQSKDAPVLTLYSDNLYRLLTTVVARVFGRGQANLPAQVDIHKLERLLKTLIVHQDNNTSLGIQYNPQFSSGHDLGAFLSITEVEDEDFVSTEERLKVSEQGNICKLYYYPYTPVVSYDFYASTLEAIVADVEDDLKSASPQPLDYQ